MALHNLTKKFNRQHTVRLSRLRGLLVLALLILPLGVAFMRPPVSTQAAGNSQCDPYTPWNPDGGIAHTVSNDAQLQAALGNAIPGDVINLNTGTYGSLAYRSSLGHKSGTADKPIVIQAGAGQNPVVNGQGQTGYKGVYLSQLDHVWLRGLEVTNSQFGIVIQASTGGGAEYNTVHKITDAGIAVQAYWDNHSDGSSDITVNCNKIYNVKYVSNHVGEGIYLGYGSGPLDVNTHDIRVTKNDISQITADAIEIKSPVYNVYVADNYIHDIEFGNGYARGISVATFNGATHDGNYLIERNILRNIKSSATLDPNNHSGVGIMVGDGTTTIRNNLIYDVFPYAIGFQPNSPTDGHGFGNWRNVNIHNNTMWGCTSGNCVGGYGAANVSAAGNIVPSVMGGNNFIANANDFTGPLTGAADAGAGPGSGFELAANSEALNDGPHQSGFDKDIFNRTRTSGSWDFGAFERQASTTPPPEEEPEPEENPQAETCDTEHPLGLSLDSNIAGEFTLWVRTKLKSDASTTGLYASTNNDNCAQIPLGSNNDQWVWRKASDRMALTEGTQSLELHLSSGEVWIDKAILTVDHNCQPQDAAGSGCILEEIELTISGVEPGQTLKSPAVIFAEASGLSESPTVRFTIDSTTTDGHRLATDVICLVAPSNGACGSWDPQTIGQGSHTITVNIQDRGREVSNTRQFTVGQQDLPPPDTPPDPTPPPDPDPDPDPTPDPDPDPTPTPDPEPTPPPHNHPGTPAPTNSNNQQNQGNRPRSTVVIGPQTPARGTVTGDIVVTVPTESVDCDISFTADNEEFATADCNNPQAAFDTGELSDGDHVLGATITNPDGSTEASSINVKTNNSFFGRLRSWLAGNLALTTSIVIGCGFASFFGIRKLIGIVRVRRYGESLVFKPESQTTFSPSAMTAITGLTLTGLTGIILAAPTLYTNSQFSGNASIALQAEEAFVDNYYPIAIDGTGNAAVTYVKMAIGITPPPDPDPTPDPDPDPTPDPDPDPTPTPDPEPSAYNQNLALIQASTYRNRTEDASPYLNTPSSQLPSPPSGAEIAPNQAYHYGPRTDYLNNPAGNPEQAFPIEGGGQFRTSCEFSHFAYDDPLVYPNQAGKAHLHMFFGNTHVNAYSTYGSVINSGGSTCNGKELNRTAYWAPAMFDAQGNVRIPERIVIYYKGEGLAKQNAEVYPEGAAFIATAKNADINTISGGAGGAAGKFSFTCSDQFFGPREPASNTILSCSGDRWPHRDTFVHNIKFPQCWNGQDPSNWRENYHIPYTGGWYFSACKWPPSGFNDHTFPNMEYFIHYEIAPGENTSGWYLSSDVNPQTFQIDRTRGSTTHADWWGGWNKKINEMWINNCVLNTTFSDCGMGYLTSGGTDGNNPIPGPALKYRSQYTQGIKVPAQQLFQELCKTNRQYTRPTDAAYCKP